MGEHAYCHADVGEEGGKIRRLTAQQVFPTTRRKRGSLWSGEKASKCN